MFLKYIKSGEKMLEVYNFYLEQLKKLFNVLNSVEIMPGMTFLDMLVVLIIISLIVDLVHFGLNHFTFSKDILPESIYVGKHSEEYLSKHTKTGKNTKFVAEVMNSKHTSKADKKKYLKKR